MVSGFGFVVVFAFDGAWGFVAREVNGVIGFFLTGAVAGLLLVMVALAFAVERGLGDCFDIDATGGFWGDCLGAAFGVGVDTGFVVGCVGLDGVGLDLLA